MKTLGMGLLALALQSCGSQKENPSLPKSNGVPMGQLRGAEQIDRDFHRRYLDEFDTSEFTYLAFTWGNDARAIRPLLGQFQQQGPDVVYSNGIPQGANMLVWSMVLENIAKKFSTLCLGRLGHLGRLGFLGSDKLPLKEDFQLALMPLCTAEVEPRARREILEEIWYQTMAQDGTYDDYQSFMDTFGGEEFWALDGMDRIQATLVGLWSSPAFLLER